VHKRHQHAALITLLFSLLLASAASAQQTSPSPSLPTVVPNPSIATPVLMPMTTSTQQTLVAPASNAVIPTAAIAGAVAAQTPADASVVPAVSSPQISQNVLGVNGNASQQVSVEQLAQPASVLPPKKIEIPVPVLPSSLKPTAPMSDSTSMILPLNKTEGIDLDKEIRDVVIGNPEIADIVIRSQKQIFLIGKKTGDTNIFFTDAQGNLIRKIDIVVQPDVDGIQSNIDQILLGEHIAVKGMGDSVVLTGTATSDGVAAKARDIARHFVAGDNNVISMLRVTNEQQVLLRVRVAEAKKTVLKELGVDNLLSPQTLGPLTIQAATSALGLGPDIAGAIGIGTSDSSSTIRLLEQQGYIRTLAEPNLLAVSGETASMLAGGEYPIPIAQQNGTLSVDYKPFGVILSFLPVVLDSGRISLRISTEVSALSDQNTVTAGGFTFKSFVTRRAISVVELPSGGELMIAGLLQNDITSSMNGVPGLMNLPILGSLFRSSSFQRNETELVILVSAILAKPADPRQFTLPTDGFVPASDLDRYFLGHLQDVYVKKPPQGPNAPQALQGPLGYIVQ